MIKNEDISVVVTGKIITENSESGFKTAEVLTSIRSSLPKATIILSTWNSEPIDGLDFDVLIQSCDPGPVLMKKKKSKNSHNRQIVTSRSGLFASKTLFSIRMRSDTLILSDSFKQYWEKFQAPDSNYKVFEDYILTCDGGSQNPRTSAQLFHPSDFFHFGYTSDLLKFWNCELISDFDNFSLAPEQYFWKNCIQRYFGIEANPLNFSIKNVILSECLFVNNFIPILPKDLGLELPKRLLLASNRYNYKFEEWEKLHRDYSSNLSFLRKCEIAVTAGLIKGTRAALRPLKNKLLNIHED
ncbi:MAG: WavE lipopolysaccharide synthesis family protein [Chloroherpetonaceae bacterium]